jgi:hypothetical protein
VVLADSELKLGNDGFADLELKLGIDLFAGKSEITEGCSDFREIGDSSDLPGISDLRLSKSYGSDAADDANFGAAVAGPSPVPVLLLEQSPWVLGSTEQIKADGGDGRGDLRAESFEGPVFSGDRDGNLARCRSWAVGWRPAKAGGGALSGRIWRELQKGAWTAGRRRAKLGRCRWASGRAGQEAGGIGRAAFGFTELGEVHRNVGIPGWYAGSGIHRNAGPGGGPDDFCVLGGSLRCRPLDGARPENRGPSSKASRPGRAGFSAVNRSGVREAASRTGRKNSAGAGVWGAGAHFRRIWPSCCGRRRFQKTTTADGTS